MRGVSWCWNLLFQVSVVGIVRRCRPYETNVQYCLDDMTGPPLVAKQWVSTEASNHSGCVLRVEVPSLTLNLPPP